jgi:acetylglutamate kinase
MDPQRVMVGDAIQEVDLGRVGEIEEVDPEVLHCLLAQGYIPVVAPMALDRRGGSLNINADTAAAEIAIALGAFKLVNLTDVDGVMNADRTKVYRRLTLSEAETMIGDGTIAGGMIPKLEGCMKAVRSGVASAHVVNGNREHNLLLELFTDEGVGTMITS